MSSSSSRRRAALCCLGVLAVTATACSISDTPADVAGADEVSWLFSQTSDSGRLELTDGDVTGLVMSGVDLHTIMFADRPDRLTDVIDTATITEQWDEMFADSAPNAVLVEHRPDGETDSLVVVLSSPDLDIATRTLSYDIEVLADEDHPDSIRELTGNVHDEAPAEFADVTLFIDNVASLESPGEGVIVTPSPEPAPAPIPAPAPSPDPDPDPTDSGQEYSDGTATVDIEGGAEPPTVFTALLETGSASVLDTGELRLRFQVADTEQLLDVSVYLDGEEIPGDEFDVFILIITGPGVESTTLYNDRLRLCTVEMQTLDDNGVSGSFDCPELQNNADPAGTISATGTFEAEF